MASRYLSDLTMPVGMKARYLIDKARLKAIDFIFTCTKRSFDEQGALFAQGRQQIEQVNILRKKVNLPPLIIGQNKIVTNAQPGDSLHQYGLAFDVCIMEAGKCVWDSTHPHWDELGAIGVSLGLEWAGNWKNFKEKPHFQYTGGLTLDQIKKGELPK